MKAIESSRPFTLRMADGKEFHVPHRDYISLPPRGGFVVVYDHECEDDSFDVLPLLTMTGLRQTGETAVREEPDDGGQS